MKSNWKEGLDEWYKELPNILPTHNVRIWKVSPHEVQAFIQTEIIEKLIEDIPENIESSDGWYYARTAETKHQLRAKWLGKE